MNFFQISDEIYQKIEHSDNTGVLQDQFSENNIANYLGNPVRVNQVHKEQLVVNSDIINEMKNVSLSKLHTHWLVTCGQLIMVN